ncbi:MAG: Lrp/AsnC family transcriptional regulator [Anaerolineae bacterium]|nr:Lrp/AsnC family transcriptional regulator [Anaerolineae bacterium]
MDDTDRRLLDALQGELPLVPRLYHAVGEQVRLAEEDVLEKVARLKEAGIIRQIGPIFDSRRLGYRSTLCAFRVEPDRLDQVARRISAHPGVSHNYSREHEYNLWFTLTLPLQCDAAAEISRLASQPGVTDYLDLPALQVFKIGVRFSLTSEGDEGDGRATSAPEEQRPLTDFERRLVREAQDDLPVVPRPFLPAATRLGVTEEELLHALEHLREQRIMRRFSAVLRHRRAGFTANGMGCWAIPEERIEEAGRAASSFREVSHCYHRPAHPPWWPYTLFTMLHGRERAEVAAAAERLRQAIAPDDYALLFSDKEYKKERVRYFQET